MTTSGGRRLSKHERRSQLIVLGIRLDDMAYLLGEENGDVSVSSVIQQMSDNELWDLERVKGMRGTPWKPAAEAESLNIPTNIGEDGTIGKDSGDVDSYEEEESIHEEDKVHTEPDNSQHENYRKKEEEKYTEEIPE